MRFFMPLMRFEDLSFDTLSISSRFAPRSTLMAWYFLTLNCIRMLWYSASASSKTRARNSAPGFSYSALSSIFSA